MVEHLRRGTLLDDRAPVHEHDPVSDLAREPHLVRHDEHGHPGLGEPSDHLQHLADELRVERRRRLVEKHQLRLNGQGPRDRDPLLLPAGQAMRQMVDMLLETDVAQQRQRQLAVSSRSRP